MLRNFFFVFFVSALPLNPSLARCPLLKLPQASSREAWKRCSRSSATCRSAETAGLAGTASSRLTWRSSRGPTSSSFPHPSTRVGFVCSRNTFFKFSLALHRSEIVNAQQLAGFLCTGSMPRTVDRASERRSHREIIRRPCWCPILVYDRKATKFKILSVCCFLSRLTH